MCLDEATAKNRPWGSLRAGACEWELGGGLHAAVRGRVGKAVKGEGKGGREGREGGRFGDSGRKGTNIYTPPATKTRLLRCI